MIIQKVSNIQIGRHFRWGMLRKVTASDVSEWATFGPLVDARSLAMFVVARAILL
jgi:hypothetical protein